MKAQLPLDKQSYYYNKANYEDKTIKGAWKTVYQALGQNKDVSPVQLVENGQAVINSRSMANTFNEFFTGKVRKLRNSITGETEVDPLVRLERWLTKTRGAPIHVFKLQPIDHPQLRKIVSKMKGGLSCGIDMIDGFSLK